MSEWIVAAEASALAAALRGSVWAYPLVNAVHILGIALLVGSILPLDLRMLGFWPSVSLVTLWRVLTRTAGIGLGLAASSGSLLFITRATEYTASGLFVAKMVIVGVGIANALILHGVMSRERRVSPEHWQPPAHIRISAGISLAAWITALVLGRLIGYF